MDSIRENLSNLAGQDQAFHDIIMNSLPQFVVVGAQSSGKSSVLKRISNNSIKLPEAADVCTKLPTIVKLRRSTQVKTEVTLKGPNSLRQPMELKSFDADDVRLAVQTAQEIAMSKCPGKSFAEE
mmetsp:Transcript_12069/g.10266  ORF Transcript_12069/g.10266 Transcript_12069/m.10266 type:complete len:125 (-) Transcript_12069:611-985(-)